MTDNISTAVRAELAPTGKLRAGINYSNFIIVTKDQVTGESSGVAIDLMQDIARHLGVPAGSSPMTVLLQWVTQHRIMPGTSPFSALIPSAK